MSDSFGWNLAIVAGIVGVVAYLLWYDATHDCKEIGWTTSGDVVYQCEEKR